MAKKKEQGIEPAPFDALVLAWLLSCDAGSDLPVIVFYGLPRGTSLDFYIIG